MITIFPLTRYRFQYRVATPVQLPEYAGSALRGQFGHALRALVCVTHADTCLGCPLASSCLYTAIFEPQKTEGSTLGLTTPPVPYVIEPPAWGEQHLAKHVQFSFHFTLLGKAIKHLGIVVLAWQRALQHGIGRGNGTAVLEAIYHCTLEDERKIWHGEHILDHEHVIVLDNTPPTSATTLEFITPLRLQENGHALPSSRITARTLLMALVRRTSLLAEYYADAPLYRPDEFFQLGETAQGIEAVKDLKWRDWTRHSSRQNRTMQLGGVIGKITLQGDLSSFMDVLRLGQWLHVGKESSFGLGHYRLISSNQLARLPTDP